MSRQDDYLIIPKVRVRGWISLSFIFVDESLWFIIDLFFFSDEPRYGS